jgi:DNA replication protein DnaC
MSEIKIRDLYTGKPDAKDEINFEGLEEFIKTFVVADHFQLDSLLYGNNCFITGFKGTGKTALLFYLDNKLKDEDPITCTSFIFSKKSLPMLNVTNYKQYPIGFYHQFQ